MKMSRTMSCMTMLLVTDVIHAQSRESVISAVSAKTSTTVQIAKNASVTSTHSSRSEKLEVLPTLWSLCSQKMSTSLHQMSPWGQPTLRANEVSNSKTTLLERPMETSVGAIGVVAVAGEGVVAVAVEVAAELVPDAVSWA